MAVRLFIRVIFLNYHMDIHLAIFTCVLFVFIVLNDK